MSTTLVMYCRIEAVGFESMQELKEAIDRKGEVTVEFFPPVSGENPKLLVRRLG